MQTRFRRIVSALLPGFFAVLVMLAVTGEAQGASPTSSQANATAMGQSLFAQLRGDATSFQFAIEQDGRLELTGESDGAAPTDAVALVRSDAFGGDTTWCHLDFGDGIEAALIVADAQGLPQPCGVLGEAFEAA